MRRLAIAVWGTAALVLGWNLYTAFYSDAALCRKAPNASRGGELHHVANIVDACSNIIESEGAGGMGLAQAYKLRGNAYRAAREPDRAIRDYDMALELNPHYLHALIDRGNAYAAAGQWDKAIDDLTRAIEAGQNPLMHIAYFGRGLAYLREGRLDAALPDYEQGLRLNPNYVPGYFQRGYIHYKKGAFEDAIADFNRVIARDRNHLRAYKHRLQANCALGRREAYVDNHLELSARSLGHKVRMMEGLIRDGFFPAEGDPANAEDYRAALRELARARCRKS